MLLCKYALSSDFNLHLVECFIRHENVILLCKIISGKLIDITLTYLINNKRQIGRNYYVLIFIDITSH